MFRLNFQLGKCEFFSDDKGGGTDIVRCCFRNETTEYTTLSSSLAQRKPRARPQASFALPDFHTGPITMTIQPIQPAWSLGHHSWTLRAVKPLQLNHARVPPRLGDQGGGYCGGCPPTDLAAAAGGLETPSTFALPEHCAHGRSNAFQKHQVCCAPAGSPRLSGSPGRKHSCQTACVVTGEIPPRQPLAGESGEKQGSLLQSL